MMATELLIFDYLITRLPVVPLLLSPSSVNVNLAARKKKQTAEHRIARGHFFLMVFFRVALDELSETGITHILCCDALTISDELLLYHGKRYGQGKKYYSATEDQCSPKYPPNHHWVVEDAFREQVNSGFSPSP